MNRLIEAVERRVLMAMDVNLFDEHVSFEDGVLTIEGTEGNDFILVDFPVAKFIEGPPLRVTFNGVTRSFESVSPIGTPVITRIILRGGAGNDRILVGRVGVGAEIDGGDGNDTIIGGDGADTIDGGAGSDRMQGRGGEDEFAPPLDPSENDRVRQEDVPVTQRVRLTKNGTVRIDGTRTADEVEISELRGTAVAPTLRVYFNDELVSFSLNDVRRIVVEGHGGDDGVLFFSASDKAMTSIPMVLRGGRGDDYLEGGLGGDLLIGGLGNDHLFGHGGGDTLVGASGNDRLRGGDGDDVLSGGRDDDELLGESGDDARINRVLSANPGKRVRIE